MNESNPQEVIIKRVKKDKKKTKKKRKREKSENEEKTIPDSSITTDDQETKVSEIVVPEDERTLYVEGISYDATKGDLEAYFVENGCQVLSIRMPQYQDSGRPLGYAHVVLKASNDVEQGLKLNGSIMMGRYLAIARANPKKSRPDLSSSTSTAPPGCTTVFVKNIPYESNEEDVKNVLMVCGKIVEVRLSHWRHTGR